MSALDVSLNDFLLATPAAKAVEGRVEKATALLAKAEMTTPHDLVGAALAQVVETGVSGGE